MAKVEILTFKAHGSLKLKTEFDESYDDVGALVRVIAEELPQLSVECPVFITKNSHSGQFELSALLGFKAKENLLIQNKKWQGSYVPLDIRRQPFQACAVGTENLFSVNDVNNLSDLRLGINAGSNRLSEHEGVSLFNVDGSLSDYVKNIFKLLEVLIKGTKLTSAFLERLSELNLIVPAQIAFENENNDSVNLEGLYGISSQGLSNLNDDLILDFYKKGYIQACHAIMHSIGNLEKLRKLKLNSV